MENSRKFISVVILALVGAVGLFAIYRNQSRSGDAKASSEDASAYASAAPSVDEFTRVARKAKERSYTDESRLHKIPFEELKGADSRLIALSGAEAAWLEKHHYPTQADIEGSKKMTSSELKTTALSSNDPKQLALYAGRLADEGYKVAAMAVYNQAASAGSIYALEESALLQYEVGKERFGNSPDSKNILAANLEVAKILGDHRASSLTFSYLQSYDLSKNSETVRLQTSEFLRQLGSAAQSSNSVAPGPDPRPNQDIWSDIDRAGANSEPITIYAR